MPAVNFTSAIVEALAGDGWLAPAANTGNRASATGADALYSVPAPRPSSAAPVNYVHHTRAAHRKLLAKPDSRSQHFSAYGSLFHQWNDERFPKWLRIEQRTLMREARIGSRATYITILRELEAWGLIRYHPTRNSKVGTHISIVALGDGDGPGMSHPAASCSPKSKPIACKPHGPNLSQPVGSKVGSPTSSVGLDVG